MVFLFVLLLITVIILLFLSIKIRIQIVNFRFTSQNTKHINNDYKLLIKFYILSRIPIMKIVINKEKIEKFKSNEYIENKIKNINLKFIQNRNRFDKRVFKAIKKLNLQIKNINLNIDFGTENASLTAIIVPIISTVIAIIIKKKMKKYENQKYIINPIYINQNLINIALSGIFEIKMIHIINIIYILNKKEGVKEYERTSNRRSYDYGYE
ncbi:MAG: hypothetical protein HFJ40_04595 [Clostridia bacterium]|nr:hypothetical protein [Clostridia bacterium]